MQTMWRMKECCGKKNGRGPLSCQFLAGQHRNVFQPCLQDEQDKGITEHDLLLFFFVDMQANGCADGSAGTEAPKDPGNQLLH